ncbi:DUF547 domain-containing protein [Lacinutrix jangbogonensis]|uniref:DUF547 domain-containing protein n=1 Tax=Lacinutrix jangbogonensis TaxID=1469557 RepID=UPI00053E8CD3|nr:DUF547 domain-containing protein [Lacinutrix jangbogonensis]
MKYLSIITITLILLSCSGAKQVVENTTKIKTDVEVETLTEVTSEEIETLTEAEVETVTSSETIEITTEIETDSIFYVNPIVSHDTWDGLLKKHVSNEGNVNYNGFKKDRKELKSYIEFLSGYYNDEWSYEHKIAFWINAYNAMTVDLIIRNHPTKSIKDIKNPWDQRLWKIDNKWYNLNEIEHKILRKMNEPRIHFGIVCASFSCPKLQNEAFTASKLDQQLTKAAKEFLADKKRNNISKNAIELSKIFKWFKKDFEHDGSLINFINKYSEIEVSSNAKKNYKAYNWDLND